MTYSIADQTTICVDEQVGCSFGVLEEGVEHEGDGGLTLRQLDNDSSVGSRVRVLPQYAGRAAADRCAMEGRSKRHDASNSAAAAAFPDGPFLEEDSGESGSRTHVISAGESWPATDVIPPGAESQPSNAKRTAERRGGWRVVEPDRYAVWGEHGRGGLGRILRAHDKDLDRPVAIKELLRDDSQDESRFAREALITARLQHPSIVPIYEIGRWPWGKRFYSMKMVSGRSLGELIKRRETLAQRLALLPHVIAVADAMAYAHKQRIVHRDLKPSNILVGEFGETIVVDWGLASDLVAAQKSVVEVDGLYDVVATGITAKGTVMGTPEFMPPEQAQGMVVDERADVYALGAILYHVLTGEPPYKGENSKEIIKRVINEEPISIEERQPGVSKDLVTIVRKAMSRRKEERYPTAKEFSEDLRRFQTGQMVTAHSYSIGALLRRWIARNRALVTVTISFAILSAFGALAAIRTIIKERNVAEEHKNNLILVQARSSLDRDPTRTIAWLKTHPSDSRSWESIRDIALEAQSRGIARHVFRKGQGKVSYTALSSDGKHIATAEGNLLRISEAATGKQIRAFPHPGELMTLEFSANNVFVASSNWSSPVVNIWNLLEGKLQTLQGHTGYVSEIRFSPDGQMLASASHDGTIRLWSTTTGDSRVLTGHRSRVTDIDFSPGGRYLASSSADGSVRIWDMVGGSSKRLEVGSSPLRVVKYSPDGDKLAVGAYDGSIMIWESSSGKPLANYRKDKTVWQLSFSPDSRLLANAGGQGAVRVLDLATGETQEFIGHNGVTYSSVFSPDGGLLASGGQDGTVQLWDVRTRGHWVLRGHGAAVYRVYFSRAGDFIASVGDDRAVRTWEIKEIIGGARILVGHNDQVHHVSFSADGRQLVSASRDTTVRLWDSEGGQKMTFAGHLGSVLRARFSPDGQSVASGGLDGRVRLWDIATGASRVLEGAQRVTLDLQFSPSGRLLASAGGDGTVRVWRLPTGDSQVLEGHSGEVSVVEFGPDENLIASAGRDGTVRVWDLSTSQATVLTGHQNAINAIAFSATGKLLVSGSSDKTIRVWNLVTGKVGVLVGHSGPVRSIAVSQDSRIMVSGGEDGLVLAWDLQTGTFRRLLGHRDQVRSVAISPNGRRFASASWDRTVRIWDAMSATVQSVYQHDDQAWYVTFAPDGNTLASASTDGRVRVARVAAGAVSDQSSIWSDALTSAIVGFDNILATP